MLQKLISMIALLCMVGTFALAEDAKVCRPKLRSIEFQEQDGYFCVSYEYDESDPISGSESPTRIVYDVPELRDMLGECVAEIESPEDEMVKLLLALKIEQSLRGRLENPEPTEGTNIYVITPSEEPSGLTVKKMIRYASFWSDEFTVQQCDEPGIENAWDLRFAEHIAIRLFADGADETALVERVALIADYLTEYGEAFSASGGGN